MDHVCHSDDELRDWLEANLPAEAAESLLAHLDACSSCQAKLQTVSDIHETVIDYLGRGWMENEFQDEPQLQDAVARARAIGGALPVSDVAGKGEPEPEIVGRFGEYEILEKLASGGMGTVYSALHTVLGQLVALKVLRTCNCRSEQAISRFEREIMAVGGLDHPNIVRALDAGEVEGIRFLALEYIDGEDLSRLVHRQGPLQIAEACRLVRQAAGALQYAHEHKLVHRDVKPSNLMVDQHGQVKILDLGLVRFRPAKPPGGDITAIGQTMGTAEYMAPSQARDAHSVDCRADIYSLGCTLFYLLVGRAPYTGRNTHQILTAHRHSPIPSLRAERSDVSEKLDQVFQKMVAKTAAERHASMREVMDDLGDCLAEAEEPESTADLPVRGGTCRRG